VARENDDETKAIHRERGTLFMGRPVTSDMVLKSLGWIVLSLCCYFLRGMYERLDSHEGRLIVVEERQAQRLEAIREIKADLVAIAAKLDRMMERNRSIDRAEALKP